MKSIKFILLLSLSCTVLSCNHSGVGKTLKELPSHPEKMMWLEKMKCRMYEQYTIYTESVIPALCWGELCRSPCTLDIIYVSLKMYTYSLHFYN